MRKEMKNEITLSVKSISDMQKYIIMVNGDFLLSLDARERTDLCEKLLEEIEKFQPDIINHLTKSIPKFTK